MFARRIGGAIGWRARDLFERLIARTPSGRTEFFESDAFPWIAGVEARAGEIKKELDGLLARVDQLPNFQDIQEEQRILTQDDRWKVFGFYAYGARAEGNCLRCPRTAEIVESIPGMTTAMFSVADRTIPLMTREPITSPCLPGGSCWPVGESESFTNRLLKGSRMGAAPGLAAWPARAGC